MQHFPLVLAVTLQLSLNLAAFFTPGTHLPSAQAQDSLQPSKAKGEPESLLPSPPPEDSF